MGELIQPLDLEKIFVVILAGTPEIFTFLAVIFISGLAAYFRMQNKVAMIMFALFGVIMASYIGGLYVLIILIGGIITFSAVSKIFKS